MKNALVPLEEEFPEKNEAIKEIEELELIDETSIHPYVWFDLPKKREIKALMKF